MKINNGANEHGTLTGLADRTALDFSVVMSKGDTRVIEWCREDDEQVIAEYEEALTERLPEQVRLMLERQLKQVRSAVGKLEATLRVFGKPRSLSRRASRYGPGNGQESSQPLRAPS